MLRQPDINKKTGIRDRFFIALMYESGCRDDEILHMRLKNIVINKAANPMPIYLEKEVNTGARRFQEI